MILEKVQKLLVWIKSSYKDVKGLELKSEMSNRFSVDQLVAFNFLSYYVTKREIIRIAIIMSFKKLIVQYWKGEQELLLNRLNIFQAFAQSVTVKIFFLHEATDRDDP